MKWQMGKTGENTRQTLDLGFFVAITMSRNKNFTTHGNIQAILGLILLFSIIQTIVELQHCPRYETKAHLQLVEFQLITLLIHSHETVMFYLRWNNLVIIRGRE